jgi:hypothetical protein
MTVTAPGPTGQRRRWVIVVAGVLLLAAVVSGTALYRSSDDDPAADPTADLVVTWGGSEGHPGCVYDPTTDTVDATITIDGTAPDEVTVRVTVTAYADENTSKAVGSTSRSVQVEGTVHTALVVTIPVEKPPHVGEDDVAACRLSSDY